MSDYIAGLESLEASTCRAEPQLRVLLVAGDRDDDLVAARIDALSRAARRASMRPTRARDIVAARAVLRGHCIDTVLLELSTGDARGLETLRQLRRAAPGVPVIVLAGDRQHDLALRALRAGAQDCLLDPLPDGDTLHHVIRWACERQQHVEQLYDRVRATEAATRHWRRLALARSRRLHRAERAVAARDRAVGIVSHDLGTSLGTIELCAAALLDPEPQPTGGVRDMARIVQRAAAWMRRIVQDLLDRTSLDAGCLVLHRCPTPVAEVVGAAQALFAPAAREQALEFVAESDDDLPWVDADAKRLLQVLSNLLANAMKFTPAGGRVTLSAVREGEAAGGDAVRFTVRDSGPGIPPEELAHVCDWCWSAERQGREGTGLGLAIAKGLIEAHRGRLHVESTPGHGSTFWFTVPASNAR